MEHLREDLTIHDVHQRRINFALRTVEYGPFIKRQVAARNLLEGLVWCKFGHVPPAEFRGVETLELHQVVLISTQDTTGNVPKVDSWILLLFSCRLLDFWRIFFCLETPIVSKDPIAEIQWLA